MRVVTQRNLCKKNKNKNSPFKKKYAYKISFTKKVLCFHNHVKVHRQHRMLETFDCTSMISIEYMICRILKILTPGDVVILSSE
jgi:hypothetical protein